MLAWEGVYAAFGALFGGLVVAYQLGPRAAIYTVPVLALLCALVTFALDPVVPLPDFPYLYTASAAAPILLYLGVVRGWEGSRWSAFGFRLDHAMGRTLLLLSIGLVALYLIFTLEPGVVLGFRTSSAPRVGSFALYFLTTPLLVLGEEAMFRGYMLTKLGERVRLPSAFVLSGVLFAAFTFNPLLLGTVPAVSLGTILFTGPVVNFMVGVVAGIYFYKADWSLLGPWTFRTGIAWT
ncbi:MAG TPA: CPBP family intramembrane glutamic endopeptidase, partial [Thermoplasmata archaeon]|nr:CPBP family intramembrane glutamic endopeptidase [Thermoplasmata archaeon]